MADPFGLERFVAAQQGAYEKALAELSSGRKRSHWMWFIFPQAKGLGRSAMAERYAISSAEEARAYLHHGLLGPRLRKASGALLRHRACSAEDIMGAVDAMKLRSSMTLFAEIEPQGSIFEQCLDAFFAGKPDPATLAFLGSAATRS